MVAKHRPDPVFHGYRRPETETTAKEFRFVKRVDTRIEIESLSGQSSRSGRSQSNGSDVSHTRFLYTLWFRKRRERCICIQPERLSTGRDGNLILFGFVSAGKLLDTHTHRRSQYRGYTLLIYFCALYSLRIESCWHLVLSSSCHQASLKLALKLYQKFIRSHVEFFFDTRRRFGDQRVRQHMFIT